MNSQISNIALFKWKFPFLNLVLCFGTNFMRGKVTAEKTTELMYYERYYQACKTIHHFAGQAYG